MAAEPTSTRCPKCAYFRKATDTAPDWQCPSCGIAYAKFSGAGSGKPPAGAVRTRAAARQSAGFVDRLPLAAFGAVCGVGVGVLGWMAFGLGGIDVPGLSWMPRDPDALHWIVPTGIAFTVLGFLKEPSARDSRAEGEWLSGLVDGSDGGGDGD